MPDLLLKNAEIVLSGEKRRESSILIADGKVSAITEDEKRAEEVLDLSGLTLFPGFIDIHIHGAVGVDVNAANAVDLQTVGRFLAKNGVTAWLPTFVPDRDETYQKVTGEIEKVIGIQASEPIAQIVGVHYEGVFANEKMCGALRPEFFKTFTGN